MHDGLQPPEPPAGLRVPRMTLAGTRIGASPLLSRDERQALERAASPPRSVRAGGEIVREREETDRLHIVLEGWACRYLTTRDGLRQIAALLVPGDTANIDTLTFERPDYGVRALTAATVLAISRDQALALAAEHAGIARTFMALALTDNAILSRWTLCLGRLSARQRLAHLFCELSARLDPEAENESSFAMPVTQEHLSDALGLTSVHINRTLQQLRTEGLIVVESRTVTIPDIEQLRNAGEFDPAYLHRQPSAGTA